MTDISIILKGIYGHMPTAVVVYDQFCRMIWANEKGTLLCDELIKKIAAYIIVREKENGLLPFGKGGRFYTIELSNEKYISAEIYDISPLAALYSDPSIADYAVNAENRIRVFVSEIVYSCTSMQDHSTCDLKETSSIINNCIKIMREIILGSQVALSLFGKKSETLIRGSSFMEEIAEGCSKTLINTKITYNYEHCGAFKSDKYLMTFLMLCVCNLIIDDSAECKELRFYAGNRRDKVVLGVEAINCMTQSGSHHIRELIDSLCDLLGAQFNENNDGAEIIIAGCEDDDFIEFNDSSDFDDSLFSPYRLLLDEKNKLAD